MNGPYALVHAVGNGVSGVERSKARRRGSHNSTGSAHSKFNSLDGVGSLAARMMSGASEIRALVNLYTLKEPGLSRFCSLHGRSPALSHVIKCPSLSLFLFGAVQSGERDTHTQPIYRREDERRVFLRCSLPSMRAAFSIMLKSTQWAFEQWIRVIGIIKMGGGLRPIDI